MELNILSFEIYTLLFTFLIYLSNTTGTSVGKKCAWPDIVPSPILNFNYLIDD